MCLNSCPSLACSQMSVVHFVLRRSGLFSAPVKSKESLVFQCGVRRFSAAPVFSQHTVGDKYKVSTCIYIYSHTSEDDI